MNTHPRFIVTSYSPSGTILGSDLWLSDTPKAMGYPVRYLLEKTQKGFRVRNVKSMQVMEYPEPTLSAAPVALGPQGLRIRIHSVSATITSSAQSPLLIAPEEIPAIASSVFGRPLKATLAAMALGLMLCQVLPTPEKDKEELIPAQYAKIIMKPAAAPASQPKKAEAAKARAVAVVKTFQSAAVKKSTQALLKASMVSLLAKTSPFSLSHSHKALGSLHAPSHQALQPTGLGALGKSAQLANLKVGGFGGTTSDGAEGVGYGHGKHAAISGQGNVFVALNTLESEVDEGLSKDEVGRVIHSHIAEVRYCYESAMVRNPDVQGKLIVNFVIHPSKSAPSTAIGAVKSAKINSSTLGDTSLDQCILSRLARWHFPKPRGGVEVAVAYPFVFKSLGR